MSGASEDGERAAVLRELRGGGASGTLWREGSLKACLSAGAGEPDV